MKRTFALLLSAALLLGLLPACRQADDFVGPVDDTPGLSAAGTDLSAAELAEIALVASGQEGEILESFTAQSDREWVEAYMENAYAIQDAWLDAAVIRATGASAFEVAALELEDESAASRAADALSAYLSAREGDFTGYAPDQADMAANGIAMQAGRFAAVFICPDPEGARNAVDAALRGEPVQAAVPDRTPPTPITDVRELRDLLVADTQFAQAELVPLDEPGALASYVQDHYAIFPEEWEDCAIARDAGDSAFEIAVFRVKDAVGNFEQSLNVYLNSREAQFDPSSDEAKLLHQAMTIVSEDYVVMLACPDAEDAAWAFAEAAGTFGYGYSARYRYLNTDPDFPDRCAFTAPNLDDMSLYDTGPILAAWEKKDPSGLSRDDRKVYDAARKVLDHELRDGMSDYEKEAALYGWMVRNIDYDWTHQDSMAETPRASFEPYGGLVNHKTVCLGYATTFQLLMDMAGVECITVAGASRDSTEDHGWNMVRLNGQWYCVDVTWDANCREMGGQGRQQDWSYFNVTSDFMAMTDHQWDYSNTPEATAADQGVN